MNSSSLSQQTTQVPALFIVALFTAVNLMNQLRCPSTDQQIKGKMACCTVEFYYSIKEQNYIYTHIYIFIYMVDMNTM